MSIPTSWSSRWSLRAVATGFLAGLRHRRHLLEGVQFHPESILTPAGMRVLRNFLDLASSPRRDA